MKLPPGIHVPAPASAAALRRGRMAWPWDLALVLAAVCAFVPLEAAMPTAGLDPSWVVAMNEAVARGLVFGRDVVFTFGPYSSIYTRAFHPATAALGLWGSLYLGLSLGLALVLLLRRSGWLLRLGVFLAISSQLFFRDALLIALALAAGSCAWQLSARRPVGDSSGGWTAAALLALFFPLGLLPLVKGSMLVLSAGVVLVTVAASLLRGQRLHAAIALLAPLAAAVVFWPLAGQPLDALPAYFGGLLEVSSGYSEAMATPGPTREVVLYLLTVVVLLRVLARAAAGEGHARSAIVLLFLGTLFVAFKSGFVRHDGHALIAACTLLFAALALRALYPVRGTVAVLLLALVTWGVTDFHHTRRNLADVARSIPGTYLSTWRGLTWRREGSGYPASLYRQQMEKLRESAPFRDLPGTSDIYSHGQAELIAAGNRWHPRPVTQSYSAYTPRLADLDRAHLAGAGAPDNIVFRTEPIDGRLPALEDGPSWPLLLARYQPAALKSDALLLRKLPRERELAACATRREQHAFGATVAVPEGPCAVFATVHVSPTWAGRLATLLYKPAPLHIRVVLKDGNQRRYRFIPGMARAGFLLSPLVETAVDFGWLFGGGEDLARHVQSFAIEPPKPGWVWNSRYEVEFRTVRLPAGSADWWPQALPEPAPLAPGRRVETAQRCDGGFDFVNGIHPPPARFSAAALLSVRGWLARSAERGDGPGQVVVVLTDAAGQRRVLRAAAVPRPDVAAHFRQPALESSGFEAQVAISRLRGEYRLGLGYEDGDVLRLCPQFDVRATFTGRGG